MGNAKHTLVGVLAALALSLCPIAAFAAPGVTIAVGPDETCKDLEAAFDAVPEHAGDVVIDLKGDVFPSKTFLVSIPLDKGITSLAITTSNPDGATVGSQYDVDNYVFAGGVPFSIGEGVTFHANLCGGSNGFDLNANTSIEVAKGASIQGSIYGGCLNGNLFGSTSIRVKGEVLWIVSGGGLAKSSAALPNATANVDGSTSVTLEETGAAGAVYGGGIAGYLGTPKADATSVANVSGSASVLINGRFDKAYGGGSAGFGSASSSSAALTNATANVGGNASVELGGQAQSATSGSSMSLHGGGLATGSTTSECNFATANVLGTVFIKALEDDQAASGQLNERVFDRLYGGGCALSKGATANVGGTHIETARCCWDSSSGTIGGGYANDGATADVEGLSHVEVFGIEGQAANYENANLVTGGGFTDNATAGATSSTQARSTEVIIHSGANVATGSSTSLSVVGGGSVQGNDGNADVAESTSVTIEPGASIASGIAGGGVVWGSRAQNSSANVGKAHVRIEENCSIGVPLIGGGYLYNGAKGSSADAEETSTSIGSGSTLGNYVIGGGYIYYNVASSSACVNGNAALSIEDSVTINGNFTIGGGFTSYQATSCDVSVGGNVQSIFGDNVTTNSFAGGGMTYWNSTGSSADVRGTVSSIFGNSYRNPAEFIGGGYAYYKTSSCTADAGAVETRLGDNASFKVVNGGGWARSGSDDSADVSETISLAFGKNASASEGLVCGGKVQSSPGSHANAGNGGGATAVTMKASEGFTTTTVYGGGCVSASSGSQADVCGNVSTALSGGSIGTFNGGGGVIDSSTQSHANIDGSVSSVLEGFSFSKANADYLAKVVGNGAVLGGSGSQANTAGYVTTRLVSCTLNGDGTSHNMPYFGGRTDSDVSGTGTLILENTQLVNQPLFVEKGWHGKLGDAVLVILGTTSIDSTIDATRTDGITQVVFGSDEVVSNVTAPQIISTNGRFTVDVAVEPKSSLTLNCGTDDQAVAGIHNIDLAENASLTITQSTAPASLSGSLTGNGTVSLPAGGSIAGAGTLDGNLALNVTGTASAGQTYLDFSDASTGTVRYADPAGRVYLGTDDATKGRRHWTIRDGIDVQVASPANGTISPSGTVRYLGEPLAFAFTPAYGYGLDSIMVDGSAVADYDATGSRTVAYELTPKAAATVSATFKQLGGQDMEAVIDKLPDTSDPDGLTDDAKNTILDTKLDYESAKIASGGMSEESIAKLNEALAALPEVGIEVKAPGGSESSGAVNIDPSQVVRFAGALDAEDIAQLKSGINDGTGTRLLKVVVNVESVAGPDTTEEEAAIENALGSFVVAQHYRVNVEKQRFADPSATTPITTRAVNELPAPVLMTFSVPPELVPSVGTARTFAVLRAHLRDGAWEAELLSDRNPSDRSSVTVATDRFSTYSLVYADEHMVSFDAVGGSPAPSSQTIASGQKLAKPANPVRNGYKFGGWYRDEALTKPWDFDNDRVEGPLTLHARWIAITPPSNDELTVSFVANGGTPEPADQTVANGKTAVRPLPDPTRTGYLFGGWYCDEGFLHTWNFDDPVTSDLVLYAKWTKIAPTPSPDNTAQSVAQPLPSAPPTSTGDGRAPASTGDALAPWSFAAASVAAVALALAAGALALARRRAR